MTSGGICDIIYYREEKSDPLYIFFVLQYTEYKIFRVGVIAAHGALTSVEQERNLYPKPTVSYTVITPFSPAARLKTATNMGAKTIDTA